MLALICLALLAWFSSDEVAIAAGREMQVWLSPNVQSEDYRALMDRDWNADRRVQVFKFHSGNLNDSDFAPNTFPEFVARNGFNRLRGFGVELAIETGVMKAPADANPGWCNGNVWKSAAVDYVNKVEGQLDGAKVRWLHLDEPLIQTKSQCQVSRAAALAGTVDFMKHVKQQKPSIGIIDIEPYPSLSVDELKSWVSDLLASQVALDGLHLDINRETGLNLHDEGERERLVELGRFLADRGLRFGVIYWGQRTTSNHDYIQDVLNFYVDTAFLRPYLTDVVFQNWHPSPGGRMDVPINLPDAAAPVESHLGLLRSALSYSQTVERGLGCGRELTSLEYLAYYPDVRASGADPSVHYPNHGRNEGRCPVGSSQGAYRDVHRFFRPDRGHLMTASPDEGRAAGFNHEGLAFQLLVSGGVPGTEILYRCLVDQRRYASTDAGCEGQKTEGALGWIYTVQRSGTRPLYRLRNGTGHYLVTTHKDEGAEVGFKLERALGYVPLH